MNPSVAPAPPTAIQLVGEPIKLFTETARLEEITIDRQRIQGDGVGLGVNAGADMAAKPINRIAAAAVFIGLIYWATR